MALATGLGQVAFTSVVGFVIAVAPGFGVVPGALHRGRPDVLARSSSSSCSPTSANSTSCTADRPRVPDRAGHRGRPRHDRHHRGRRRRGRRASPASSSASPCAALRCCWSSAPHRRGCCRASAHLLARAGRTARAGRGDLGGRAGRRHPPAGLQRPRSAPSWPACRSASTPLPRGAQRPAVDPARLPAGVLLHPARHQLRADRRGRADAGGACCSACSC